MAQSILRDAETEAFFDEISAPLIAAAGLDPNNVDIILINDKSINAFVAGGQAVYLHSGLLDAATSANEVQGVIAHELGHVVGGHVVRFDEGVSAASGSGAQYLSKAGITGRGSISFFKKLQNFEFRLGIPQEDSYGRTHPLSGERIAVLQDTYSADPAWNTQLNPKWENDFKRIKAKLTGYLADPNVTFRDYPDSDKSVPARYARAYAWHKSAYPQKALDESSALVASAPDDPYFLELHGQILLESGRPADAIIPLRKAVNLTGNQPLIAAIFGHALIATEDKSQLDEAAQVLKAAVTKDNQNPFAWYQLGVVYEQKGDTARAALASAERYLMEGAPQFALPNAQTAMAGLPENSPDWIRAQDINMVAEAKLASLKKRRR